MRHLPKMIVDEVDFSIANILRHNARISYKELGNAVSLSTPAVFERTKKLEMKKVILDYQTEIDYGKFGYALHAFILLKDDKFFRASPEYLVQQDYIQNCWVVTGEYDYLIEVFVENNTELGIIIDELYDKVGRTYTLLIVRNARYMPYSKPEQA